MEIIFIITTVILLCIVIYCFINNYIYCRHSLENIDVIRVEDKITGKTTIHGYCYILRCKKCGELKKFRSYNYKK